MDTSEKKNTSKANWVKLLLKIAVSVACLWYVFSKINFSDAVESIKQANPLWLIAALLIYSVSKFIGAQRLSINFNNIGIHLPQKQNVKLYWLGMFYNLFLPGAITGDAYKVILLSRKYKTSYKKTTAAVILDRFSGLLALGLLVAMYSFFAIKETWIISILVVGSLAAIPILYYFIKFLFADFLPGFWPTFILGAIVQLTILICVYFIIASLNINEDIAILVFIFLVAVIISVLPISVGGGLGVREFAIIEGAKFAGLGLQGQHNALILSLLFYLITVICSLAGVIFVINDPFKIKTTS